MSKKWFSANTDRKVTWATNMYHEWCKKRLENALCNLHIKSADIDCLSKLDKTNLSFALSNFINETKQCDGKDFPAQTLYQITVYLQFHVTGTGLEWKLIDDPVFIRFQNMLDNVMKVHSKARVGHYVHASPITVDQEEIEAGKSKEIYATQLQQSVDHQN